MSVTKIANQEAMPKRFQETRLDGLDSSDIVRSANGKGGDYSLVRAPQDIGLDEIIVLLFYIYI